MNAIAYTILSRSLTKTHGTNSTFAKALGKDTKGYISLAFYILGLSLSFVNSWVSLTIYAIVALIWLVPDTRFEKQIG